MRARIKDTKYIVRNITFGEVALSENEERIYELLNNSKIDLCKTLPRHMQNKAMQLILDYSDIKIGEPLDFYKNFYKPVWTIIPAMAGSEAAVRELSEPEYAVAMPGQAMSLYLHSIDNHLNDGEIPPSHLLLLLRSQAWLLFNKAISEFAAAENETDLAVSLINEYYEGMYPDKEPACLDEYCNLFRKEISTWYIMPMLAAIKIFGKTDSIFEIKKTMGHFGIAWRLLDDIQDAEEDIDCSRRTSLYHSLPEEVQKLWDKVQKTISEKTKTGIHEEILRELSSGRILDGIMERIIRELDTARKKTEALGMHGLAEQYRSLGGPVRKILNEG